MAELAWLPARAIALSRFKITRNAALSLRKQSRLKIAVVTAFVIALWAGLFGLLYDGFVFINTLQPIGPILADKILALFYMALFFMLIFSNIFVSFSTLYAKGETDFLMAHPLKHSLIFTPKFIETMVFSSWAFLFLMVPLMLSYGIVNDVPLRFYLLLPFLFIPFLILPAVLGTLITMLLVKIFPGVRARSLFLGLCTIMLPLLFFAYRFFKLGEIGSDQLTLLANQILTSFRYSQYPLLPSYWLNQCLTFLKRGDTASIWFYFLLLVSNMLFFLKLCYWMVPRLYYDGWAAMRSSHSGRNPNTRRPPLGARLGFIKQPLRAFIAKDVRVFVRDPAQWSQFTIFFGLLAIYVSNLRNMSYDVLPPMWKNTITFLNLGATGLVLATLTTRFVFPLLSLEGKRMWIMGLAPVKPSRILYEKLALSFVLTSVITQSLTVASNIMLRSTPFVFLLSCVTVFLMSLSLTGLSVGLGAVYPNFKEENPARIVSGMGGTLNLLLCLSYLVIVILVEAIPLHAFTMGYIAGTHAVIWIGLSVAIVVALSVMATVVPVVLGHRNLLNAEF